MEMKKKRTGVSILLVVTMVLSGITIPSTSVAYANDELGLTTATIVADGVEMEAKTDKVDQKKKKVKQEKQDIQKAKVKKIKAKTYTGKAIKPTVKVTFKGKKLKKGRDYKLTYKNNVDFDSTAKIYIKGKGKYKGTKVVKFKIKAPTWKGAVLNRYNGVVKGPSGYETYYNLYMGGVVSLMRQLGYSAKKYPYWVRNDGVKMFGKYVMVGAYLPLRPKGTILQTSLGMGMVCDTGVFAYGIRQLDIAVSW